MSNFLEKLVQFIKQLFAMETPQNTTPTPEPAPTPIPVPNPLPTSKIDLWCHAIQNREGFFSPGENPQYPNGTPAWQNNNPGNCVYIGQPHAVKNGRFAKFDTYQDGYDYLKNMLIDACTGKSKIYNPNMTLLQFYEIYSPASDGNDPVSYATQVANAIGCTVDTVIKNLIS